MSPALVEFALNYLSWGLLCIGLPRHYSLHFGTPASTTQLRTLRNAGWLLAIAAMALGIHQMGWGIGTVMWASTWMLAAIGWVLLQPYRPRLARALAPALLALAALCYLMP